MNNKSEIDSPVFFLSKQGKTNSKDELLQTLHNLLNEKIFDDNSTACKFPARKNWLQKKLNIKKFPAVTCTKYNEWLKELDPTSVSLIFPSAHINSPASMFGHTFLRINSSYKSKLLSHAVNYAANMDKDTESGFLFTIKGLFGGYYGQYSLLPYYDKLKEYRDTEQRDIWEYDLNLNKNEVMKMTRHIWELKDSYSDYYFFDENCSYNMLWLLEIARPNVELRNKFIYHVSPPETIFQILNENLVKSAHYRPSKRKVLLAYENELNKTDVFIVKKLAKAESRLSSFMNNKDISVAKKQLILEASTELCEYYFIQGELTKSSYLVISYNLSKQRASLGSGKKLKLITPMSPEQGHRQLSVFLGYRYNNDDFITIGIRPTYHDITNNDSGFLDGTQIEFLTSNFLYNTKTNKVKMDYLKILKIVSLSPNTKFFNPLSWMTNWTVNRESLNSDLNFNAKVSVGKSFYLGSRSYFYSLVDLHLYKTDYSYSALGATIGAVLYTSESSKLNIESSVKMYDNADSQKILDVTQSYFPHKDIDIKLNYKYIEKHMENDNNINLSIHYFF